MTDRTIPGEINQSIIPYLTIKSAGKAIEFYKKAFGAKEIGRISMPDGKVGHAELQIGNSIIMLSDEVPEWGNRAPDSIEESAVSICLYVENVDEIFKRAIEAGAKIRKNMEVKDQFYGDRSGGLTDPFGHKWTIATQIEKMSFEEMQKRSDRVFSQQRANV